MLCTALHLVRPRKTVAKLWTVLGRGTQNPQTTSNRTVELLLAVLENIHMLQATEVATKHLLDTPHFQTMSRPQNSTKMAAVAITCHLRPSHQTKFPGSPCLIVSWSIKDMTLEDPSISILSPTWVRLSQLLYFSKILARDELHDCIIQAHNFATRTFHIHGILPERTPAMFYRRNSLI